MLFDTQYEVFLSELFHNFQNAHSSEIGFLTHDLRNTSSTLYQTELHGQFRLRTEIINFLLARLGNKESDKQKDTENECYYMFGEMWRNDLVFGCIEQRLSTGN
jgi:hypothetical protein